MQRTLDFGHFTAFAENPPYVERSILVTCL